MGKISAFKIVDLIYRDFKPSDSNWVGDAWDMIGDAIEGIGYHVGFDDVHDELTIANNQIKWPRKYTDINFVEYRGRRLPLGADLTDSRIGASAEDTVDIDPYRLADLKSLSAQWQQLEDWKSTATPEQVLEYAARQEELMVKIIKLSSELNVKSRKTVALGQYYQLINDYIVTSFSAGTIIVHGTSYPISEEGVPYIVDTFKYRQACFFKVASLLLLQGYKHPVLNYELADVKWEYFRAQASNEPRIMGVEANNKFAKMWTKFKFNTRELDYYFKNSEQT